MRHRGFRLFAMLGGLMTVSFPAFAAQDSMTATLVQPAMTKLAELERCVPESTRGHCASIALVLELSGIDWLDHALLQQFGPDASDSGASNSGPESIQRHVTELQKQAVGWLDESYATVLEAASADEPYFLSYERSRQLKFLYQRANLAFYRQLDYDYYGGAHGMYASNYLLFDLNAQKELQLKDILLPGSEAKLAAALREVYLQEYSEYVEHWLPVTEQEQLGKMLVDNFVFTDEGLVFVYPLYELAPYSSGEIRLTLGAHSLQGLLQPQYSFGY